MLIRERKNLDLDAVKALLLQAELPLQGLAQTRGWVAAQDDKILAHIALEAAAEAVVLRSLVVDAAWRGKGIARRLMQLAESASAGQPIYLRTRTIEAWVERLGYRRVTLDAAPASLRQTSEFSGSICTSVAIFSKTHEERMEPVRTFIFACIHNAGRSQMAAAFFNRAADPRKARGISAGTQPAEHVHPGVVEQAAEKLIV
jgi:N-acetylglutamate synthase-like GNAT family acetyltransferase